MPASPIRSEGPAIVSSVTRRKPTWCPSGQVPRSAPLPARAVLLPGSGSDDVFVRRVFARPLGALGITLEAVAPPGGADPAAGYRAALDATADDGVLVGGVSLGGHGAAVAGAGGTGGAPAA